VNERKGISADKIPVSGLPDPKWLVIDRDLAYEWDSYQDLAWSLALTRNMLEIIGA